ncbi:MAG: DUF438 domain-containing protein [Dethiobacter sp.]|jgi:PAS domain S-box-containing protein|nr:DUF438 domain-containing protein [Dethiobacter sp.]
MSGNNHHKKAVVRDIILQLHRDLPVEEAKKRFEEEVGNISSIEIAEIEQSLINDGMSPDEIKKFCNVHALLFQSSLAQGDMKEEHPAHPVQLFRLENREIEKITASFKEMLENAELEPDEMKGKIREFLLKLRGLDIHYTRKEQVLFPYLEKYGFIGPSKVMWGKDDEIRNLHKASLAGLDALGDRQQFLQYREELLNPLIEEIEGMIFKEENILFPTSLEKLASEDWVEILMASDDVGYVFIRTPEEAGTLVKQLKNAVSEEPSLAGNIINMPTGQLSPVELTHMLNTLPLEITFIDKDDTVKYFSDHAERIFIRTKSVIGRKVHNCHPPQSVEHVEKIVTAFKEGRKDSADFWLNFKGRLVYIKFYAVRDREGKYLGTMEITMDITDLKKVEGEKRLLDEKD